MSATKIEDVRNVPSSMQICGTCWHMVRYFGQNTVGWCGNTKSAFYDIDCTKNTKACSKWNVRTSFNW